ncbi:hypothetical protein [Olsenella uli]|uniref:hypothetical protein n=1 Tax=Olsenella uli TaxID=133926 RepID=UPI00325FD926
MFTDGNDSFVLKGGQAVLACTIGARMICGINLLAPQVPQVDLDGASKEPIGLTGVDLGNFVTLLRLSRRIQQLDAGGQTTMAVVQ